MEIEKTYKKKPLSENCFLLPIIFLMIFFLAVNIISVFFLQQEIDLYSLYPCLAEMELNLPAFVAHRVKKLQTQKKFIEEIDCQPEVSPRPPSGKLKQVVFKGISSASAVS